MYTLHKLPEGFIVTSYETPKGSDLIIWTGETVEHFPKQGTPQINYGCIVESVNYSGTLHKNWKKVIAQQDKIDLSALSEEEQKRIGWFDVEKLAELEIPYQPYDSTLYQGYRKYELKGFINGFQKAYELLSDRGFTLEKVLKIADKYHNTMCLSGNIKGKEYLQSLSQPRSWKVELEMEKKCWCMKPINDGCEECSKSPKFINGKIKILRLL